MKVLLLDPFADIWVSSFPTAVVAEAWSDLGHEIHVLRCDGVLGPFCHAMSAKGLTNLSLTSELEKCCTSCKRRRNVLGKNFEFKEHLIENFLPGVDRERAEFILRSTSKENWKDLFIESIPVGKIASYELILEKKLASLENIGLHWIEYQARLKSTLFTYFAIKNVIRTNQIEAVAAYNGLYSINRVALLYADSIGIQAWAIAAGSHLKDKFSEISIYRFDSLPVYATKSKEWHKVRRLPMSVAQIESVKQHFEHLHRAKSNFVYSGSKRGLVKDEIFTKLKVPRNKKIILATMSSHDEMIAMEAINFRVSQQGSMFANPDDWIRFLLKILGVRDDVHLIIRIHPRQFPNKREKIKSEEAVQLEQLLSSLPSNVTVNWPSDQISLYDLASITDLVLNRTSSAGLELSALGIPTLLCDPELMIAYDPSINTVVKSKLEYELAINRLLDEGRSVNHAIEVFRFLGFMFGQVCHDISEGFSYPASGYLSRKENFVHKLYNKLLILADRRFHFIERRAIRARQKLSNKFLLGGVFTMLDDVLIGDVTEERLSEDQERFRIENVIRGLL